MNRFTWEEWILARAEKRRRDDERAMNDLGAEEPGYELFWDEKERATLKGKAPNTVADNEICAIRVLLEGTRFS
jgi:hypothetical protein